LGPAGSQAASDWIAKNVFGGAIPAGSIVPLLSLLSSWKNGDDLSRAASLASLVGSFSGAASSTVGTALTNLLGANTLAWAGPVGIFLSVLSILKSLFAKPPKADISFPRNDEDWIDVHVDYSKRKGGSQAARTAEGMVESLAELIQTNNQTQGKPKLGVIPELMPRLRLKDGAYSIQLRDEKGEFVAARAGIVRARRRRRSLHARGFKSDSDKTRWDACYLPKRLQNSVKFGSGAAPHGLQGQGNIRRSVRMNGYDGVERLVEGAGKAI
jgi:hypothetical protein